MTIAVNPLGLPAVALPVGNGVVSQAVQVIGHRYREDLYLRSLDTAEAL